MGKRTGKKKGEKKDPAKGKGQERKKAEGKVARKPVGPVPPPESVIWPEFCRGERWKPAFAFLFAGKCQLCAYSFAPPKSRQLTDKWLGQTAKLLCTNCPGSPGELQEVLPTDTCRNFKPKSWKRARSKPAKDLPAPAAEESDPTVRRIPLGNGLFATVDAADYEELSKYKWHVSCHSRYAYVTRRRKDGKTVYMHREIMKPPKGYVVDHIDANKLNHCRSNLRVCTRQQNQANMGPRGGSSRFVGVTRRWRKWQAEITHRGKHYYLGLFADEVEAAKARDRKAYELNDKYAYLNFPEDYGR